MCLHITKSVQLASLFVGSTIDSQNVPLFINYTTRGPLCTACAMHADGKAAADTIDGLGASWTLPLLPLSATSMPEPFSPGDNPRADTTCASAKLIRNHKAVVRFAARGAGKGGTRPVSAPLSDPSALPQEAAVRDVDAALRHVAHSLLVGAAEKQAGGYPLKVCVSKRFSINATANTAPPVFCIIWIWT